MIWFVLTIFASAFAAQMAMMPKPRPPEPPAPPAFDWEAHMRRIELEDARLFAECPSAFWNDPHRYGGKRLHEYPAETLMWADLERDLESVGLPLVYGNTRLFGTTAWVPGQ